MLKDFSNSSVMIRVENTEFLKYFVLILVYLIFFIIIFLNGIENYSLVYAVGGFDDFGLLVKKFLTGGSSNKTSGELTASHNFYGINLEINKKYQKFNSLSFDYTDVLKSRYATNKGKFGHSNFLSGEVITKEFKNNNRFSSFIKERYAELALIKKREVIIENSILIEKTKKGTKYNLLLVDTLKEIIGDKFCKTYMKNGILKHPLLVYFDEEIRRIKIYIFTSYEKVDGCENYGLCEKISDVKINGDFGDQYMRNIGIEVSGEYSNLNDFLNQAFGSVKNELAISNLKEFIDYNAESKNRIADIIINNGNICLKQVGGTIFKFDNGEVSVLDCSCTQLLKKKNE
jgi:hypothetical protein